ncbi:MAG: hypothetical protein IJQ13_06755 [Prevotella sp.]|nr:hypothetical protein [Prevotella sp.]
MDNYDDIINLPHYEPKHHPRMSMWNRAAQFAPFAALTGYDAAIKDAAQDNADKASQMEGGLEDFW